MSLLQITFQQVLLLPNETQIVAIRPHKGSGLPVYRIGTTCTPEAAVWMNNTLIHEHKAATLNYTFYIYEDA